MIKIEVFKHGKCSESQIISICKFKNLNWSYPIETHLNWIKSNLEEDDVHLLLWDDNKLCAYLNLVDTHIVLDSKIIPIWGIGNVCVAPEFKGMGYGNLIMDIAKFYCKKDKRTGVLFCQDKNVGFYKNCNWVPYNGIIIGLSHTNAHINTFTTQILTSEKITLQRDF